MNIENQNPLKALFKKLNIKNLLRNIFLKLIMHEHCDFYNKIKFWFYNEFNYSPKPIKI